MKTNSYFTEMRKEMDANPKKKWKNGEISAYHVYYGTICYGSDCYECDICKVTRTTSWGDTETVNGIAVSL